MIKIAKSVVKFNTPQTSITSSTLTQWAGTVGSQRAVNGMQCTITQAIWTRVYTDVTLPVIHDA